MVRIILMAILFFVFAAFFTPNCDARAAKKNVLIEEEKKALRDEASRYLSSQYRRGIEEIKKRRTKENIAFLKTVKSGSEKYSGTESKKNPKITAIIKRYQLEARIPRPETRNARLKTSDYREAEINKMLIRAGKKYGASYRDLRRVMICESSGNPKAYNPRDPDGGSRGLFQFQRETFGRFAPKAGIARPDIWNPEHQANTAAYMFAQNLEEHWTCARKLGLCGK